MDYIDANGPTPYKRLADALGWKPQKLSHAVSQLPGWSRRVTMQESIDLLLDERTRMVERPS